MNINGGNVIANILEAHGVQSLFTLCGGHISPILVGCKKVGIRIVDVRHEATALFAADATARMTGGVGVAAVTAGPGVTNTITALKNAQLAHSPVLLLGGAAATVLKGRGSLQDIDQTPLMRSVCKFVGKIKRNSQIAPILEKAIQTARSGVPGPVFVECPIDLLYDEALVREWYGIKSDAVTQKGLVKRVIQFYLNYHLDRAFNCDLRNVRSTPRAVNVLLPKPDQMAEAARMLAGAQRPVLIIGSQAMLFPQESEQLTEAVERLKVPLFLTGMARGAMGQCYPLQMRHHRKDALKRADLVILAGMPCDFRLNYGGAIRADAKLIAVNRSRRDLYLNRRPTLAIQADPFQFLRDLARRIDDRNEGWPEWIETLRQSDLKRDQEIAAMGQNAADGVNPISFLLHLEQFLDNKSVIVADGGDFVATASYILRPRRPLAWLDPGVFGTLGVGAGFAMGAQVAKKEAGVWLLYGDGAAGFSLAEFDTFVRHKLPVIAVVGNDAGWAQIARDQTAILKDDVGTALRPSDYHVVAEGFGAKGFLISSENEIQTTLEAAQEASTQGWPVLINVLISKTQFREGSISM